MPQDDYTDAQVARILRQAEARKAYVDLHRALASSGTSAQEQALESTSRIFGILAEEAPVAVLLRRGPTRWVRCILWHTDTDTFELGQWFAGRIYEHRSSLSPNGKLFVYFASKHRPQTVRGTAGTESWTAISRPPYLTALALWPKDNSYNGGGIFPDDKTLQLNHDPRDHPPQTALQRKRTREQGKGHLTVLMGDQIPWFARGEDRPISGVLGERQGWRCVQPGELPPWRFPVLPKALSNPAIWEKSGPDGRFTLSKTITQIRARSYPHTLRDTATAQTLDFTADWADFDQHGRLVYAQRGQLFAVPLTTSIGAPILLADFNAMAFEEVPTPVWATRWPE